MTKDSINKDGITFRQALKEYEGNLTPCESDTSQGPLINGSKHPKNRNLISGSSDASTRLLRVLD